MDRALGSAWRAASSAKARCWIATVSLIVHAGCTAFLQELDRIPQYQMSRRLSYQGFSFDRPPSSHWFLYRSQEKYTDVTLWRQTDSKTHSMFARVALFKMSRRPSSHEDFGEIAKEDNLQHDPEPVGYEVERTAYTQSLVTKQNQWCIRFDSEWIARKPPVFPEGNLLMTVRGFNCVHPAFPDSRIAFFYSERYRAEEADPKIAAEGETFLNGVVIDVAPNTPAS